MKKVFEFDPTEDTPIVTVRINGKGTKCWAKLVFDTGSVITQINTMIIDSLGYSAADGKTTMSACGPAGPMQDGYTLQVDQIEVLGKTFSKPLVATYDFDYLEKLGIDGLLDYDFIKQFHLEMNGPKGELIVFDN